MNLPGCFFFFLLLRFFTLGEKRSQENQRVVVRAAQCSSCLWLSVLFPLSAALWGWSRNNWKKEIKTKNRTKVVCVLKVKLLLSSQRIKNQREQVTDMSISDSCSHLSLNLHPLTPPSSPTFRHLYPTSLVAVFQGESLDRNDSSLIRDRGTSFTT